MGERPGPNPEEMGEETKPGIGRREFLKGLAGFVAAAGLSREAKGEPQQTKEKGQKEKLQEVAQVALAAKKLADYEEQNYKKYIKSPKDSDEEWNLHLQLNSNRIYLNREIGKLGDLAGDTDNKVADEATKVFLGLQEEINRRDKECRDAGKLDLGGPPRPKNPLPKR